MIVSSKSKAYQSWRCLNASAAQAGFRKDEVACKTKKEGMPPIQLPRSSLCFLIQGRYVRDPSEAELRATRAGCAVILEPRPSKADKGGFHWCDKPIFYPWSADDPLCAASELIAQELMDPLHGDDRAKKPLFSDSNGAPFSRSQVEAGINDMIQLVVPASDVKKCSFHSYRIKFYLCTALDNVGCPPSKIKRISRWLSDEALQTCARDGEQMYAK